jgi:hypothetical protein
MTKSSLESDVSVAALMITQRPGSPRCNADTRHNKTHKNKHERWRLEVCSVLCCFGIQGQCYLEGLALSLSLSLPVSLCLWKAKELGFGYARYATLSIHAMSARCMDDKRFALVVKMGH